MRFISSVALACSLPFAARAAPVKRQASSGDLGILKFAEVLNRLELQFYKDALAKFQDQDFTAAGFTVADIPKTIFQTIEAEEQAHIDLFTAALQANNDKPLEGCSFDFSTVLTDVPTMVAVSRVLENVGVSAFLGAAPLLTDKSILGTAATIVTTEARHSSLLHSMNSGVAIPQAFDQPLTPPQVVTLAAPFIKGCDLGIAPNPPVTIKSPVAPGAKLEFDTTGLQGDQLFCQMVLAGYPTALSQPIDNCMVPPNLPDGPVFIFITNDQQPLASNIILQNAGEIVAGPTLAFIDQQPDALSDLVRVIGNAKDTSAPPTQADANGSNQDMKVIGLSTKPLNA